MIFFPESRVRVYLPAWTVHWFKFWPSWSPDAATGTGSFNSRDVTIATLVAAANPVTLANGTGGLASNYSLAGGETAVAHITFKALTATATAPDKVYDGGVSATPTLSISGGLVKGETVTATGTDSFNSKDVTTAIPVTNGRPDTTAWLSAFMVNCAGSTMPIAAEALDEASW